MYIAQKQSFSTEEFYGQEDEAEAEEDRPMSYEGYNVYLCALGHRWTADFYNDNRECPHCTGQPVWSRGVDQTNGDGEDPELKVETPAPQCESCGQPTGPVRYVIPGK
jgi:hypothetical protein